MARVWSAHQVEERSHKRVGDGGGGIEGEQRAGTRTPGKAKELEEEQPGGRVESQG